MENVHPCDFGGSLVACHRPTTFSAPDDRWLCRLHHHLAEYVRKDTCTAGALLAAS